MVDIIDTLTRGAFSSPADMKPVDTRYILIQKEGMRHRIPGWVSSGHPTWKRFLVVSDANTYPILGKEVGVQLSTVGYVDELILEGDVKAADTVVERIKERSGEVDLVVAIGSGTINDLCKYASFQADRPYIVFPTAPSMNGYLSANASISIKGGYKASLPAHLPMQVYCDLETLASAPIRLIQSGVGDLICRSTCQADWLLSHLVLETPYKETPFLWMKALEKELHAVLFDLIEGDLDAMEILIRMLLLSGLTMYYSDGSYPASQGEHIIAHVMELTSPSESEGSFHGEQIAVTTLFMAQLQADLLAGSPVFKEGSCPITEMQHYFGKEAAQLCAAEVERKWSMAGDKGMAVLLEKKWLKIQKEISPLLISARELRDVMHIMDGASEYTALGWSYSSYCRAIKYAPFYRDRFTFLDVAFFSQSMESLLHRYVQ